MWNLESECIMFFFFVLLALDTTYPLQVSQYFESLNAHDVLCRCPARPCPCPCEGACRRSGIGSCSWTSRHPHRRCARCSVGIRTHRSGVAAPPGAPEARHATVSAQTQQGAGHGNGGQAGPSALGEQADDACPCSTALRFLARRHLARSRTGERGLRRFYFSVKGVWAYTFTFFFIHNRLNSGG